MISILICDDNPIILTQVQSIIKNIQKTQKFEFFIDLKSTGDFAIKSKAKYDIAIVDIEMPGINGLKLSELLRKNNPDIIVMIL